MSIFALVHGAWHGPWCWERVAPLLRERGHEVVTPDLPSEDTELGLQEYADAIEGALGDADDVVLVPHSLGGLVGPVVAARRPRRRDCGPSRSWGLPTGSLSPDRSRRVARERLGVEPVELPAGHFSMITHPEPLADALSRLARG